VSGTAARFLRVYLAWILLCGALVGGVAWVVSERSVPMFASTASVVVESRVLPNTTPVVPDVTTEKEVVESGVVVEKAAAALGVDQQEIEHALKVTVPPDTKVLTITYRHPVAAVAQRRAQAIVDAYLDFRNADPSDAGKRRGVAKGSPEPGLQARLLTPATFPNRADAHHPAVIAVLGMMIGLALGLSTALCRDALRDQMRGREDFEQRTGAEVLAEIPRIRRGRHGSRVVNFGGLDRDSAVAEAFRYLRVRLAALGSRHEGSTVVLVTSAAAHEGRTTVVSNLATSIALSGARVIAVDADLRHPALHMSLGTERKVGLSNVLAGECGTFHAVRPTLTEGLSVMAAGWSERHAGDLLAHERLQYAFDSLRERADYVIVDCPPVLAASDAVALAMVSDVVVLVVDDSTTRRAVDAAGRQVAAVPSGVLTGVVNHRPRQWPHLPLALRRRARNRQPAALAPAGPVRRPQPVTAVEVVKVPQEPRAGRSSRA